MARFASSDSRNWHPLGRGTQSIVLRITAFGKGGGLEIRVVHGSGCSRRRLPCLKPKLRWKNAHRFYRYCSCCVWSRRFWSNRLRRTPSQGANTASAQEANRIVAATVQGPGPAVIHFRTGLVKPVPTKAGRPELSIVGKGRDRKAGQIGAGQDRSLDYSRRRTPAHRSAGLQENERSRWHLLV